MNKPEFVYVTYIATTPEKLWGALTDGEITRQYWGGEQVSDWKPGSRWEHRRNGPERKVAMVGTVIESDPPNRLVFSWAAPKDRERKEGHSRVMFEIERAGELVRLTVTHEQLEAEMCRNVSGGWPKVLSNLKSFLETGRAFELPSC
jgi:uncharacterized protein YndB with AHSA1/START domain